MKPVDSSSARQPTIYIPHGGGPWPFMDDPRGRWKSLANFLEQLPQTLPQEPKAVVVVTAHWEAAEFSIASGRQPHLIYDYGGFPPHTYEVEYPAPGAPDVAALAADLAGRAGIDAHLDPNYGWDHGVFVPIAVSWPKADVPVVAVSLKRGLDPAEHLAFGSALAALRDDNVVIIGSGLSTHDLSFSLTVSQADEFDEWLDDTMRSPIDERAERLVHWADAPSARAAHPREEHLLPLMVVTGAGGTDPVERTYHEPMLGLPSAAYAFNN